ncbi:MAG TPA: hypothetical protein VML19_04480 [Verrucomicrobiae bacterium]|nr:hypothetical protein [Verrucomicrobiae bacterium]
MRGQSPVAAVTASRRLLLLLSAAALHAQPLSYVASVKINTAIDAKTLSEYQNGRFTATAITVSQLLRIVYGAQPYQLTGAPGWISTKR